MTAADPGLYDDAFNCPTCGAYAHMTWFNELSGQQVDCSNPPYRVYGKTKVEIEDLAVAQCARCREVSVWSVEFVDDGGMRGQMKFPRILTGPEPNPDMPEGARDSYEEARMVAQDSPRAAAALLRLTLEQVVNEIDNGRGTLNDKIGRLKASGTLRPELARMMDVVRISGNNFVHPGQLDPGDIELLNALFKVVDLTIEQTISEKKRTDAIWDVLPQGSRDAVDRRDAAAKRVSHSLGPTDDGTSTPRSE